MNLSKSDLDITHYLTKPVVILFIVFRLVGYLLFLVDPLLGIVASILVFDSFDYLILGLSKVPIYLYHQLDKPLDYLMYLILIPYLVNTPIFTLYIILLFIRTIGMIVFAKTKNPKYFIIFPNLAEYLALGYFVTQKFNLGIDVLSLKFLVPLYIIKVIHEWFIHFHSLTWVLDLINNWKKSKKR